MTRPSIAELQRLVPHSCPRCGAPDQKCAGAPKTVDERAEDDAVLLNAAPVLLEIAAAALAYCSELDRNNATHRSTAAALEDMRAALAKVAP